MTDTEVNEKGRNRKRNTEDRGGKRKYKGKKYVLKI